MGWFRRRSKESELGERLRSERPAPRPAFLRAVASRIDAGRTRTSPWLRIAFASGLTLAMVVAVASVGGVSNAASGAHKVVQSVGYVLSSASSGPQAIRSNSDDDDDDDDDADEDQYVKDCKDAVKQKIKAEQELHKANKRAATTKEQKKAENARHKAAMRALEAEKRDCGRDDDDDDDD